MAIASAEIPFGQAQGHLTHHPAPSQIPSRRVAARDDAVVGAQNDRGVGRRAFTLTKGFTFSSVLDLFYTVRALEPAFWTMRIAVRSRGRPVGAERRIIP